jgi:hypothetical protein
MAHQFTNHGDRSTDYLTTQHPNPSNADAFKSSYDDLIDQYAEPYSRISRHQTFKVQTHTTDDSASRGPSYSLDNKSLYLNGKIEEEEDVVPELPQSYPPKQKQEKVVDNRSCWQRVSMHLSLLKVLFTASKGTSRLLGMSTLRDNRPC